jgi:hypothetical protein
MCTDPGPRQLEKITQEDVTRMRKQLRAQARAAVLRADLRPVDEHALAAPDSAASGFGSLVQVRTPRRRKRTRARGRASVAGTAAVNPAAPGACRSTSAGRGPTTSCAAPVLSSAGAAASSTSTRGPPPAPPPSTRRPSPTPCSARGRRAAPATPPSSSGCATRSAYDAFGGLSAACPLFHSSSPGKARLLQPHSWRGPRWHAGGGAC